MRNKFISTLTLSIVFVAISHSSSAVTRGKFIGLTYVEPEKEAIDTAAEELSTTTEYVTTKETTEIFELETTTSRLHYPSTKTTARYVKTFTVGKRQPRELNVLLISIINCNSSLITYFKLHRRPATPHGWWQTRLWFTSKTFDRIPLSSCEWISRKCNSYSNRSLHYTVKWQFKCSDNRRRHWTKLYQRYPRCSWNSFDLLWIQSLRFLSISIRSDNKISHHEITSVVTDTRPS